MRHESLPGRLRAWAPGRLTGAGLALLALLAACAGLPDKSREVPVPVVDRVALQGAAVAGYLDTLQRLVQVGPVEQAEILAGIKRDYDEAPTPSHELRLALARSTPGHPGWNLAEAQRLLRELMASPEALLPAERALAFLEGQRVDRQLLLASENQRLRAEADRLDRERTASAGRRLQTEIDENARLRRQLEDALAKLDAIANIERSITERKSPTEGRRP
jgi:hypothetical protein